MTNKTLCDDLKEVFVAQDSSDRDIISACLTFIQLAYRAVGSAEKDVVAILKECVEKLNETLPENEKV